MPPNVQYGQRSPKTNIEIITLCADDWLCWSDLSVVRHALLPPGKRGSGWTRVPRGSGERGLRCWLHGVRFGLRLLPVQGETLSNQLSAVVRPSTAVRRVVCLCQTAPSKTLVVPLLNIRQADLVLRSDNLFLLRQTGFSPDLLLFRDQLDLQALHRAGRLRLTLVDHNVLPR